MGAIQATSWTKPWHPANCVLPHHHTSRRLTSQCLIWSEQDFMIHIVIQWTTTAIKQCCKDSCSVWTVPVYQQGEKLLWFAEWSVCGEKRAHKVRIYKEMKQIRQRNRYLCKFNLWVSQVKLEHIKVTTQEDLLEHLTSIHVVGEPLYEFNHCAGFNERDARFALHFVLKHNILLRVMHSKAVNLRGGKS